MTQVYCVSLGPGDPELMTLKAVRVLRASHIIYCPCTEKAGATISRAGELLSVIGIAPDHICYFSVPMNSDRSEAFCVYREVADQIEESVRRGQSVSFVAEGDSGFYSSVHYISDTLLEKRINVLHIAGVPAFIAAGAMANLHIVKQHESLLVLPSTTSVEQIISEVRSGKTVVLMKLSRQETILKSALTQLGDVEVHYFENVGIQEQEYHTSTVPDIVERSFPYFSLMIIKQK